MARKLNIFFPLWATTIGRYHSHRVVLGAFFTRCSDLLIVVVKADLYWWRMTENDMTFKLVPSLWRVSKHTGLLNQQVRGTRDVNEIVCEWNEWMGWEGEEYRSPKRHSGFLLVPMLLLVNSCDYSNSTWYSSPSSTTDYKSGRACFMCITFIIISTVVCGRDRAYD